MVVVGPAAATAHETGNMQSRIGATRFQLPSLLSIFARGAAAKQNNLSMATNLHPKGRFHSQRKL
jgi:hypothetical protein